MEQNTLGKEENESNKRVSEADAGIRESNPLLKETDQTSWKTTLFSLTTPILLALVALAGTAIGAILQGYFTIQLEREKFRIAIIQKATESGSQAEKANSLRFLVETGVIDDPGGRIIQYSDSSKQIPTLLPLSTTQQSGIVGEGWIFIGTDVNGNWTNRTIDIKDKLPEKGEIYTVINDVYLRADHPTDNNQSSHIIKTVFAGTSVQIIDVFSVPKTNNYWCQITLTTSGAANNGEKPNTNDAPSVKRNPVTKPMS